LAFDIVLIAAESLQMPSSFTLAVGDRLGTLFFIAYCILWTVSVFHLNPLMKLCS